MPAARMFRGMVPLVAVWVLVLPGSAQAACSGQITLSGFEFTCPNQNPTNPADGAWFRIELRGSGEDIVSGSVTSPAGFSCEVEPSRRGSFNEYIRSSISCRTSPDVVVPPGQKVTGTWKLSSGGACDSGAVLATGARTGTDDGLGALTCAQPGRGQDPGPPGRAPGGAGPGGPGGGGPGGAGGGHPGVARCVVPALVGKTLEAAKKRLSAAHCALGKIAKKKGPKSKRGKVTGQTPKASTIMAVGAKVALVIGK